MTTFAQSFASSAGLRRERLNRGSLAQEKLVFWLPLIVIGVALLMLEHRWGYATETYWSSGREVDLVAETGSSNTFRQLSLIALGAMGAALLLKRSKLPIRLNAWIMAPIVAICVMVVLSALWADDGVQSLKRSAIPLLTVVAALGIGKHWHPRQVCRGMAILTLAYLAIGIAATCATGIFLPTSDYRFTGTLHPNIQGVNCAMLCLASIVLFWTSTSNECTRRDWRWLVPLFIGVTFLILTGSRTATVGLLAAGCLLLMLGASHRTKFWSAMGVLFVSAVIAIVSLGSDSDVDGPVLQIIQMGREQDTSELSTLTGRTAIWNQVLGDIAERPFFGYGYGGFWTPETVLQYSYLGNWEFNHAHSAYLETMLGIGLLGLMLGLAVVATAMLSAVRVYRRTKDASFLFIAALLAFALVHGLLDTSFVSAGFASLLAMICISVIVFQDHQTAPTGIKASAQPA